MRNEMRLFRGGVKIVEGLESIESSSLMDFHRFSRQTCLSSIQQFSLSSMSFNLSLWLNHSVVYFPPFLFSIFFWIWSSFFNAWTEIWICIAPKEVFVSIWKKYLYCLGRKKIFHRFTFSAEVGSKPRDICIE